MVFRVLYDLAPFCTSTLPSWLLFCFLIYIRYPRIFFFFNFSQIYQDCSYLKAFVLSLKSSFHTGFLLAGSQFKYHLFKKSCITTYSDFLTQLAYMPNSHHYLELSCTYLLTCLSVSALTVYLNNLRARTLFMLLSKA